MLWLRGWLQQASSEGPRCADGSLFKEIRLSREDCQRERQIDPIHPGCETEMIDNAPYPVSSSLFGATEMVPLRMNLKDSSRNHSNFQDSDYSYEYVDYQDNKNNDTLNASAQLVTTVPTDTLKIVQTTENIVPPVNNTIPIKKATSIPPSPSSSGFTFFGVPLPSLNFNLWGNSGRKSERKNSSNRPGRGRYRTFPPTEPEIHRGGFVPLPRGQGGFVPIVDPRLTYERQEATKVQNSNVTQEDRKRWKSGNGTVVKVERTPRPNKSKMSSKEREELSTSANERDSRWQMSGTKKNSSGLNSTKTSDSSTAADASHERANETSVSIEVYDEKNVKPSKNPNKSEEKSSMEIASRIVWSTPKTPSETTKGTPFKETSTEISKGGKHVWNSEEFQETLNTATNVRNESIDKFDALVTEKPIIHSTLLETQRNLSSTSQSSRDTEASALSAFLVPGGQVPSSSPNLRPLGRPTITKVPSPRIGLSLESEKHKSVAQAVQRNVENEEEKQFKDGSPNENAEVIEDNFNWYFQHYNDTNIEPYVGVAYSGCEKTSLTQWTLLGQTCLMVYIFI